MGGRLDSDDSVHVEVTYAARRPWVPRRAQFSRWAEAALLPAALARRAASVELSVRIVGAARSRSLNARYRHKDKPTNVLSVSQGKAAEFHWAHMTVHGVLHLLGFDHERAAEARKMESREAQILDRLGFSNPYV